MSTSLRQKSQQSVGKISTDEAKMIFWQLLDELPDEPPGQRTGRASSARPSNSNRVADTYERIHDRDTLLRTIHRE
jgi:hypothetical protein